MIRRLMVLNVLLIGALWFLGYQLRQKMLDANRRETAMLKMRVAPPEVTVLSPLGKIAPLDAAKYQDSVSKNLFSKDRSPVPIPDPPPVPPPPPLPPAFPVARGVMIWDGLPPTVVLSTAKGSNDQRGYHPGERVGDWKILSVDNQYIVLEWKDKQFKKRLDELMDRTPIQVAEAAPAPAAAAPPAAKSLSDSKTGKARTWDPGFGRALLEIANRRAA